MFTKKLFALSAATLVISGTPNVSRAATATTSSVSASSSFMVEGNVQAAFMICANRTDLGAQTFTGGKVLINVYGGSQYLGVNSVAKSLRFIDANQCVIKASTVYAGLPIKIEAYLKKGSGANYFGWRILRQSDNSLFSESGREKDGSLKFYPFTMGALNFTNPR